MMSKIEYFFTQKQEQQVVDAIRSAEKDTSGEIRVHIEYASNKETIERATEVFYYLKMDETVARNGVLFYLGIADKKFAIIGDKNINKKVTSNFWENTKNVVLKEFKATHFVSGLVKGILNVGKELKQYFPYKEDDKNELSDHISVSK